MDSIYHVPRTACGQCVNRFISGYIVTTDNEEAPSRILSKSNIELLLLFQRHHIGPILGQQHINLPIPIQLQQNAQARS